MKKAPDVYIRKDHSLSAICQRFFETFASRPNSLIQLETIAGALGVRKRRMYDIVNVLESVNVVQRKGKNEYIWFGSGKVADALRKLKVEAAKLKPLASIGMINGRRLEQGAEKTAFVLLAPSSQETESSKDDDENDDLDQEAPDGLTKSIDQRKEKSLRALSEKFVQIFLIHGVEVIRWEFAVEAVLEIVCDTQNLQTKARRLYDVANILAALHLLEKTAQPVSQFSSSSKPAYRFLGADGVEGYLNGLADGSRSIVANQFQEWNASCGMQVMSMIKRKRDEEAGYEDKENYSGGEQALRPKSQTSSFLPVNAQRLSFHDVATVQQLLPRLPLKSLQIESNLNGFSVWHPSVGGKAGEVGCTRAVEHSSQCVEDAYCRFGSHGLKTIEVEKEMAGVSLGANDDTESIKSAGGIDKLPRAPDTTNAVPMCSHCGCTCQRAQTWISSIGNGEDAQCNPLSLLPRLFTPDQLAQMQHQNPAFMAHYVQYWNTLFQMFGQGVNPSDASPRSKTLLAQFPGSSGVARPVAVNVREINEEERAQYVTRLGIGSPGHSPNSV